MLSPIEKEELINQIIAQNERQLLLIARQNAPADEAKDLYQEILYELWKSLDRFEGRASPGTWACAVALNTANVYVRKKILRKRALREYGQNMPSRQPGGRSEEQILREFSQSLPETERRLLPLYMAGLNYQQMAEHTGILESTLRSKITRLREQFQKRYL